MQVRDKYKYLVSKGYNPEYLDEIMNSAENFDEMNTRFDELAEEVKEYTPHIEIIENEPNSNHFVFGVYYGELKIAEIHTDEYANVSEVYPTAPASDMAVTLIFKAKRKLWQLCAKDENHVTDKFVGVYNRSLKVEL